MGATTQKVEPLVPVAAGQKAAVARTATQKVEPEIRETGISSITGPAQQTAAPGAVAASWNVPYDAGAADTVNLNQQQLAAGNQVATDIAHGAASESLQAHWAAFVASAGNSPGAGGMDVNALVQWVLRQSYMQQTSDLEFYAEKVQFYNQLKQAIRNELAKARQYDSSLIGITPANGDTNTVPAQYNGLSFDNDPNFDNSGNPVISSQPYTGQNGQGITDRAQLETYIQNLEDQLNSVGDDAQLANVDLQDQLQKQQATLQLVSNISKMLYDTALAVIRKIGS